MTTPRKNIEVVYFQCEGIKPDYCEVGLIYEDEPDYVYFVSEPCRILLTEVKIIPEGNVTRDTKPPFSYRVSNTITK